MTAEDLGMLLTDTETVSINVQPAATFSLGGTDYFVEEAAGVVTLTVQRTGSTEGTATVEYATSNGSATSTADYIAASGTLTFTNGECSATITLSVVTNSTLTNGDEYFTLSLGTPSSGASIDPSLTTGTIYILTNAQTPLALNQTYSVVENQPLDTGPDGTAGNLLGNDFDLEGDNLTLVNIKNNGNTYTPSTTAQGLLGGGTIKFDAAGDFIYTPASNATGTDALEYTVGFGSALVTGQVDFNITARCPC